MNINIYHWKEFTGFLRFLPLKPSNTTPCFMHMQEKIRGQKRRGPADAIEPHPFSGAGRSRPAPGELCTTSRQAKLLLLHRLAGSIPAHPGRAPADISHPSEEQEGWSAGPSPSSAPCRSWLHAESHAKAKQHRPSAPHPEVGSSRMGETQMAMASAWRQPLSMWL